MRLHGSAPAWQLLALSAWIAAGCGAAATNEVAPSGVAAPTNVVATATSSTSISITWTNADASQTGVGLERSATSATAGFGRVASLGAASTSHADSGLTPGTQYWYRLIAEAGARVSPYSAVATATTGATGTVTRPAYNRGTGFFVLGGKIYDANGNEFRPKGFNTLHYALDYPGLPASGANIVRMNTDMSEPAATLRGYLDNAITHRIVPVPYISVPPSAPGGAHTTCNTSLAVLESAVQEWIDHVAVYQPYERYMMLNIANEWGTDYEGSATAWRDAYASAIPRLRSAGYHCPILVDTGGCGQDPLDIIHLGADVYDADPEKNVVISWHIYAGFNVALTEATIAATMGDVAAAATAGGFPFIIGEFGPGPPLDTVLGSDVHPLTVMQTATALGRGWIYWAWDDYGTPFQASVDGSFLVSNGVPTNGLYPNNTDLTAPGNVTVLHPDQGTFHTARRATIFP